MEKETVFVMELDTNTSNKTCSEGGKAWIFVVSFATVYTACLVLCSLAYISYWLFFRKSKSTKSANHGGNSILFGKRSFRGVMRQLKSGDTILAKIFITITLLCNLAYIALAFYRSLPPLEVEECIKIGSAKVIVELMLVCELLLFSLVRFLASKNIIKFWFNLYTIVDVCTLSHIFVTITLGVDWVGLRFLRFAWLIQIVTVLQFTRLIRSQNALELIQVFIYFMVLWLSSSGILYAIEAGGDFWKEVSNASTYSVLTYIYMTMVTMSTVGYGDFSPVTDLGRTFMILFIIGGLAFFAYILPELVDVITRYYKGSQYSRFDTSRVPRHVIVCGHVTADTAEDFLKDFLHPDRGDRKTHVLLLHPERPEQDLKTVLRTYYTRVQFLVGSVLNGNDLKKAKIFTSSAIFILADKHTDNPRNEDHANMLRVVSIKNANDRVPVIIQLVHSFSKSKVTKLEGWCVGRDITVSISELKLGLLGMSCLCPGLSTLLANFFYTINAEKFAAKADVEPWKKHFAFGISNELYSSSFSEAFDGMTFHQAAKICFNKLKLTLLAVEYIELGTCDHFVNPSPKFHPNLQIKSKSMLGYFIAQDQDQVYDVSIYCECCEGNRHISAMKAGMRFKRQLVFRRATQTEDQLEEGMMSLTELSAGEGEESGFLTKQMSGEDNVNLSSVMMSIGGVGMAIPLAADDKKLQGSDDEEEEDEEEEEEGDDDELTSFGKARMQQHSCDPVKIEDAILNPSILRSVETTRLLPPSLQDHVILCLFATPNSPILGLYNFLQPLRSKHLASHSLKDVVIVCNRAFMEKEWPNICAIPQIYLVVGSPLLWKNLKAAKIKHCSVCIVMSLLHSSTSDREQAIDDKEAILCTLSIKKHLKKLQKRVTVITDLQEESNVQFLDFGEENKPDDRIFKSRPYACGEAFSVSMFDSVMSSAFHNPGTISLIEDFIYTFACNDNNLVVPMPVSSMECAGQTFKKLFNAELKKYNLCLGISRKLPGNGQRYYVISCPHHSLVLEESDIVFVLTTVLS